MAHKLNIKVMTLLKCLALVDQGKLTLEQWYKVVLATALTQLEYGQLAETLQQIAET